MLATSWNCSKRLTGRKVRILYLEVLMQLLYDSRRGDNEEDTLTPTESGWGCLFLLYTSQTFCTLSPGSTPGVAQGRGGGKEKSLQANVLCFSESWKI